MRLLMLGYWSVSHRNILGIPCRAVAEDDPYEPDAAAETVSAPSEFVGRSSGGIAWPFVLGIKPWGETNACDAEVVTRNKTAATMAALAVVVIILLLLQ